ncbi:MAG: FxsA family protein [Thermochromatium sp.]
MPLYLTENAIVPLFILFFIALPLIELYVLIRVGSGIGALPTILLSILTAIMGVWLVRHQGFGVLRRVRDLLDRGEVPAIELLDGALILAAGLCLLVPGFLTDGLGFLLLIPPLRHILIARYIAIQPLTGASGGEVIRTQTRVRVIEGEFRRDD